MWFTQVSLRNPVFATMVMLAFVVLAVSMHFMLKVPGSFLPPEDVSRISASVELPPGTTLEQTDEAVSQITEILMKRPEVESVFSSIGSATVSFGPGGGGSAGDANYTRVGSGGTGSFAGYRGELTLSANGRSITAKLGAPAGKAKPTTWFEDDGRYSTPVEIPGGTFTGIEGSMFKAADRKKKAGAFFASRIEYAEIDGVTPVLTMLEQEFTTGTMIVTGIMNPFWMANLASNQAALAAGQAIPHTFLPGFWDHFLFIGGVAA